MTENSWKITDFGTASAATSMRMNTTKYSRGTSGYRAPEILMDDARFNNKVDFWSLGCVLYETGCCVKMFSSDNALLFCTFTGILKFPVQWPLPSYRPTAGPKDRNGWEEIAYRFLYDLIHRAVKLDPFSRPSSREIAGELVPKVDMVCERGEIWSTAEVIQFLENVMESEVNLKPIARKIAKDPRKVSL
jgi:serine/threonine protein kinase